MSVVAAMYAAKELKRLGDQMYANGDRKSQGKLATAKGRPFTKHLLHSIDLCSVAVQKS